MNTKITLTLPIEQVTQMIKYAILLKKEEMESLVQDIENIKWAEKAEMSTAIDAIRKKMGAIDMTLQDCYSVCEALNSYDKENNGQN